MCILRQFILRVLNRECDNGTSCSEPPLLSAFFSRILLEGFNTESRGRTWGAGQPRVAAFPSGPGGLGAAALP